MSRRGKKRDKPHNAKTINAEGQQRKREQERQRKAELAYHEAEVERNIIDLVLEKNTKVEEELASKTESDNFCDCNCAHLLEIKPLGNLKAFIHACKFTGNTFQESKLKNGNRALNKTLYRGQAAKSIEKDCSAEDPCYVWLAWSLRSNDLVLKATRMPVLDLRVPVTFFDISEARPVTTKCPSDYLRKPAWVNTFKRVVKGVNAVPIDDTLMTNADNLGSVLEQRFGCHIVARVDKSRYDHWTLQFTRDNIPPMAAAMCLFGHIVSGITMYSLDECLLNLLLDDMFQIISRDLGKLEGCYLYYDEKRRKWIRSDKTSGEGEKACFEGRGAKHIDNSKSLEELTKHKFYMIYPAAAVKKLG